MAERDELIDISSVASASFIDDQMDLNKRSGAVECPVMAKIYRSSPAAMGDCGLGDRQQWANS
jgi:hypothetical protein